MCARICNNHFWYYHQLRSSLLLSLSCIMTTVVTIIIYTSVITSTIAITTAINTATSAIDSTTTIAIVITIHIRNINIVDIRNINIVDRMTLLVSVSASQSSHYLTIPSTCSVLFSLNTFSSVLIYPILISLFLLLHPILQYTLLTLIRNDLNCIGRV